jgi:fibronectin-binding autotransporter adhesin
VTFDPTVFNVPRTLTLTEGPLELTDTNVSGSLTVTGPGANLLTVNGNHASRVFDVSGGTAAISGLTITGGSAQSGGGLYDENGTISLTNVTVSGNSASGAYGGLGGGLFVGNDGGAVSVINCTVSGNSASNQGGGLIIYGGTVSLTNTIVAGQTAGGDVTGPYTGTNNLIGGDPLLAPLGNYGGSTQTMPLLPGSPVIGGGTATGAPATDQRGVDRTGHVDIGAFQSQGFTLTPISASTPQSAPINTAFGNGLTVTVRANDPQEPVAGGVITFNAPSSGASANLSAAITALRWAMETST